MFNESIDAGIDAEREKAGLLPGRPPEDGIAISTSSRRPADIWLRRGLHGGQEALDFAVTSGLRSDLYRAFAENAGTVFSDYETYKREYKSIEQLCQTQGLRFTPMVLEAHGGGWSPLFRGVADWLAQKSAAALNEKPSAISLRMAQRISCTLQRENARAIMRRQVEKVFPALGSSWAELADTSAW